MIQYRIIQDIKELKNMSKEEIIAEDEVYGSFNIKFNNNETGYFLSKEELPLDFALKNDVFLYHDCLIWWFESICEVCKSLESTGLARLDDLENNIYSFIFKKNGENLEITCIKQESSVEFEEIVDYEDFITDFIKSYTSFKQEIVMINENFSKLDSIKKIDRWIEINKNEKRLWF